MDKRSAEFIHAYFPNSTIEHVMDMTVPLEKRVGRPTLKTMSNVERQRKFQAKKRAANLAAKLLSIPPIAPDSTT
jgi:hypothetical protein